MAVVDGLRDVYYEFAYKQAKESASLKSYRSWDPSK
jgi:hypothetical protein